MLLFSLTTARPMHRVRALAEAYGLTVGYDSAKNMATVDGAARTTNSTGSFSSQWTVTEKPVTRYGNEHIFTAVYSGPLSMDKFKSWWKSMNAADLKAQARTNGFEGSV